MCCQIQNADVCFHFKIPSSLAEKRDIVELGNTIRLQLIEKISLFLQTCKYRPVKTVIALATCGDGSPLHPLHD